MTTTATTPAVHISSPSKGKYGRSEVTAYFGRFLFDGPAQGVMVTLPKVSREIDGYSHLINIWKGQRDEKGHTPVFYAKSRKEAIAILTREVTALHQS